MDNPTKMWMCNDSTDLVANGPLTQTTLPIAFVPSEDKLTPPILSMQYCQPCSLNTQIRSRLSSNSPSMHVVVMDVFWTDFEHKSFLLEYHANHNFSWRANH